MIIYGSKHRKNNYAQPVLPPGQLVNKLGKFLYRHLDGAFKYEQHDNMCDVYITVLYSIPADIATRYELDPEIHEMTIDVNITTYQNKIRVDTIEVSPEECTLGFDLFPPEMMQDLNAALDKVYAKVVKRITNRYKDWDFIF